MLICYHSLVGACLTVIFHHPCAMAHLENQWFLHVSTIWVFWSSQVTFIQKKHSKNSGWNMWWFTSNISQFDPVWKSWSGGSSGSHQLECCGSMYFGPTPREKTIKRTIHILSSMEPNMNCGGIVGPRLSSLFVEGYPTYCRRAIRAIHLVMHVMHAMS